jgi:hypothetical protein
VLVSNDVSDPNRKHPTSLEPLIVNLIVSITSLDVTQYITVKKVFMLCFYSKPKTTIDCGCRISREMSQSTLQSCPKSDALKFSTSVLA